MMRRGAVVVGVGSDGAPAAVAYAVDEARSCGCDLDLVHVVESDSDRDVGDAGVRAKTLLEAALVDARSRAGDHLVVRTEIILGSSVASALVARSSGATLLVLERHCASGSSRGATGAVIDGVAGLSHAPVHVVPREWATSAPRHSFVTCGVQDESDAEMLMRLACVEAERRADGEVVVLRTWAQSEEDIDTAVDVERLEAGEARLQQELAPRTAELRQAFPTVDVTVVVEYARPAEALLGAAERSELLVIGRRRHLMPHDSHLGPVVRTVLDRSQCPVLIAPETPVDTLT